MIYSASALFALEASDSSVDFSLPSLNKAVVSLSDYRGKVVYLDFWASWCRSCKESLKWMEQLQLRYGEEGLAVIAINLDTDSSKAREFLVDQPSFEVLLDPEGSTPEAYGVSAVPSSYIIDRHGKIAWVHRGFRSKDAHRLEERIGKLLRN